MISPVAKGLTLGSRGARATGFSLTIVIVLEAERQAQAAMLSKHLGIANGTDLQLFALQYSRRAQRAA